MTSTPSGYGGRWARVDLTRPWWRCWSLILPFVLASVVFDHDGALVGGVAAALLCAVFWPMAIAPVWATEFWPSHRRADALVGIPIAFPAMTLWFNDASLVARIGLAMGFGVLLFLVAAVRGATRRV